MDGSRIDDQVDILRNVCGRLGAEDAGARRGELFGQGGGFCIRTGASPLMLMPPIPIKCIFCAGCRLFEKSIINLFIVITFSLFAFNGILFITISIPFFYRHTIPEKNDFEKSVVWHIS